MNKKYLIKGCYFGTPFNTFFAGVLGLHAMTHADLPIGIIGGENNGCYAELILNQNGALSPIDGLPNVGSSLVDSVSMNQSRLSLIGGSSDSSAYAAFVKADGTVIPLTLGIPTGIISQTSINSSGLGLIVGTNVGLGDPFIAYVKEDGTVTNVPATDAASIQTCALNNSGLGLVGGEGTVDAHSAAPYLAYVTDGPSLVIVSGLSVDTGHIRAVSINQDGTGLVVGSASSTSYGALVYPSRPPSILTPLSGGDLYTASINNSGVGLIGGFDNFNFLYAGSIATDGTVTRLTLPSNFGIIESVALNNSGMGLIGGSINGSFYAAFVDSHNNVTPLFDTNIDGEIHTVAINSQGIGLIGGQSNGFSYGALVAPNGTLTPLDVSGSVIHSVSLADYQENVFDQVLPTSIGPYSSPLYMHLAAATALEMHLIYKNKTWNNSGKTDDNKVIGLGSIDYDNVQASLFFNPRLKAQPKVATPKEKKNSLWLEPFGNLVYLKDAGSIPQYSNEIAGVLVGYDREDETYIAGVTAGYAYNYASYKHGLGHAQIQEEMLSAYGSYYADHFWIDAALWGGVYQLDNTRRFLSLSSKGNTHGWIVDPHLELASPWAIDVKQCYFIEPFVQWDWVNQWQHQYTEKGHSGFNLQIPSLYHSLLQSECGLRFYEKFVFGWGDFCLEEKLSYIIQAPFGDHSITTSFVSSVASFPVAIATNKIQNLGAGQVMGCFVPKNSIYPYGGFSFEAAAGSSYQSYFLSLFIGEDF